MRGTMTFRRHHPPYLALVLTVLGLLAATALPASAGAAPPKAAVQQAQAMQTWFKKVGGAWQKVQTDLRAVTSASQSGKPTAVTVPCTNLAADVATLRKEPPAPAPSINAPWQAALRALAAGGNLCKGAAQQPGSQDSVMRRSETDLGAAERDIEQAAAKENALTATAKK
jgi:hypothetical protein